MVRATNTPITQALGTDRERERGREKHLPINMAAAQNNLQLATFAIRMKLCMK